MSNQPNDNNNNLRDVPPSGAAPERPNFLAAVINPGQPSVVRPSTMNLRPKPAPVGSIGAPPVDVININDYQSGKAGSGGSMKNSNWSPVDCRPVPAFYPLEKSTRLVEDETPREVAARLSESLRYMSVQAIYDDETATASLLTAENVEMHMCLWKTPSTAQQDGVLVEIQRRKGDSLAFHRYARQILDAAVGEVEPTELANNVDADIIYSKKVQRLLAPELKNQEQQEHENAVVAIEIAHGLIMKDRMDARQLGLESLCLLTDPKKTGYMTAVLASHVVLLGSTSGVFIPGVSDNAQSAGILMDEGPFQEIRQTILGLVQFSRIGEEDDDDAVSSPESEHMLLLHNLALAVLANALDVIEHPEDSDESESADDDLKPRSRLGTAASEGRTRLGTASSEEIAREFMHQSEEQTSKEILSTLISELGKAGVKPHNAALSAKCIGSLCRASEDAKRKAKELGAKNVVSTALEVGCKTHLRLETECQKVMLVLQTRSD